MIQCMNKKLVSEHMGDFDVTRRGHIVSISDRLILSLSVYRQVTARLQVTHWLHLLGLT